MRTVVICAPLRTPIGRLGGVFRDVPAQDLASTVIAAIVAQTGLDGARVDDVIFGQAYPTAEAPPIARVAALDAGLPVTVGGLQLDRRCGSGLQAVLDAAMQVQTSVSDLVIAGGVDSMSQAPFYTTRSRFGVAGTAGIHLFDALGRGRETAGGKNYPVPGGMLETAENLRREYSIGRLEQDELAVRSQRRALAAVADGYFDDEIVPVVVPARRGAAMVVDHDETPRESTLEALGALPPVRLREDPFSTVTAGNASGQNDAAAAMIVTTPQLAAELGLTPVVRLAGWARSGVEPARMGLGPVAATSVALERAEIGFADLDLIELNEAFAAQVLAVAAEWRLGDSDWSRVNPLGSGISLGHPVGATGARMLVTGSRHLARTGGRYLLETMCIGGGQGLAAVFERV
jgi:acetyl-CoA acetyltransferase family protein